MRTFFGTLLAFWPWLTGMQLYLALLPADAERRRASVAGHGLFLGLLVVYLLVAGHRRLDRNLTDATLWFYAVALLLLTLLLGAVVHYRRQFRAVPPRRALVERLRGWLGEWRWNDPAAIFAGLLLALILGRLIMQAVEIWHLPIFPWDAWMNWAPKAKIWFELSWMVDFANPDSWLAQSPQEPLFTLGNRDASEYPELVPMLELWVAFALGYWHDGTVNLPWVACAGALGLAFFAQLREIGVGRAGAAIGTYLLLSAPLVNAHTTLAGYADLWLAAAFFLAMAMLARWRSAPRLGFLLLMLFYCLAMTRLKNPGIILGGIVAFTLLWSYPLIRRLAIYPALIGVGAVFFGLLEIDWAIGDQFRIKITHRELILPLFGAHTFQYRSVLEPFRLNLGALLNWNIAWYLFVGGIAWCLLSGRCRQAAQPWLVALLATATFLFLLFSFTRYYYAALDYTTLNRAFLYTYPIGVFMLMALFYAREVLPLQKMAGGPQTKTRQVLETCRA